MEINRKNIFDILKQFDVAPDKDYGQNFLTDNNMSESIVSFLDINKDDSVLEIGPGLGSLTHFVAEKNVKTAIVDIDNRMASFLSVVYKDYSNISIVNDDVRRFDVRGFSKILGNLPYNITTELVLYFLINAINARKMVFMCQTEAYSRFSDLSGKAYGPASILVHLLGTIKKVKNVPAGSFYPAPKCSSTVFVVDINEDVDRKHAIEVYKFAKQLFANRRKTIYNNLSNYLNDREKAFSVLQKVGIDINKRPEDIQYFDIERLFASI